jgi:hypothetical protein
MIYEYSRHSALMTGAIDETEKEGNRNWYVFNSSNFRTKINKLYISILSIPSLRHIHLAGNLK